MALNPKPGSPSEPTSVATGVDAYLRALLQAAGGAWKKAFGMDGVRSHWAAQAAVEMIRKAMGWSNDMVGTQAGHGLNPNAYLQLFTLPEVVIPDGWTLQDSTQKSLLSKITDGNHGATALRVNNTNSGFEIVVFRSPLIPVHPDWIYMADGSIRHSDVAGGTADFTFRFYDQAKALIGELDMGKLSSSFHSNDVWENLLWDSVNTRLASGTIAPKNSGVSGAEDTRYIELEISMGVAPGETCDWDFLALKRVPEMVRVRLNDTTSVSGTTWVWLNFDEVFMDRGGGVTKSSTLGATSIQANATAFWTAPYEMDVMLGSTVVWSGGPTNSQSRLTINDSETEVQWTRFNNIANRIAMSPARITRVKKGDFLKWAVWHDSGAGETLGNANNEALRSQFWVQEVPTW